MFDGGTAAGESLMVKEIQAVVDKMRLVFTGGKEYVSKPLVLKWAREIEAALKKG